MGSIRDELLDSMWDSVRCEKHNWVGPDSRFSCPYCKEDKKKVLEARRDKAVQILEPYGLEDMIKWSRYDI